MRARTYVRVREKITGLFTILFSICPFSRRPFPLHYVPQNDPSLFIKRPVTFHKTTRHFS